VHPFGPDLNGFRQYYATLLRHPEGGSGPDSALRCLAYVDTLAKIDPTYPSKLARGTLFARLGNYDAATSAFQEQLEISQHDGPYTMLARNYFLFARARSQQSEP
jgi:predicted RNA polymerase sigma factor